MYEEFTLVLKRKCTKLRTVLLEEIHVNISVIKGNRKNLKSQMKAKSSTFLVCLSFWTVLYLSIQAKIKKARSFSSFKKDLPTSLASLALTPFYSTGCEKKNGQSNI